MMPYADTTDTFDATEACKAMDRRLRSWNTFQVDKSWPNWEDFFIRKAWRTEDLTIVPANAVSDYWRDIDRERESEKRSLNSYIQQYGDINKDERPYFKDPQPLSFDPIEVCKTDTGKGEEGVKFRRVWKDPIARTIWLAIKARHITSQYFRGACIEMADDIRKRPPTSADDLRIYTGDHLLFGSISIWFRAQLWPYIVYELRREKRWPYFMPPPNLQVHNSLGWIYTLKDPK